ncbi:aldehyde dehydrogenase family protein [Microbacterium lacus]|uniref:Aldehyde dehydrogenase family protein n=1 Tax=Microbacterium lacus TaxID=415217 RepID=A0ABP4TAU2_9MICO
MAQTLAFIDGSSVDCTATYENIDPADGRSLGTVVRSGPAEVDAAVEAAGRAQRLWRRATPEQRAGVLTRLGSLIFDNRDELAVLESEDTGKPLSQALADVDVCARYMTFYGHAIDSYYGLSIPIGPDHVVYTRREPFGVAAHILAWNYPLQLLGRAIGPALATGNACVVKPADETPRSAVRVAELAIESGLPKGVLNVIPGIGAETGALLAEHQGVAHIGFVGSTAIGAQIARSAAERTVPTTLELGGKSAQIVFPDADLDAAVPVLLKAIIQNAGQTCSAGARLLVHRHVHAEIIERLGRRFETVTMGRGIDDPDLGPLISVKQQKRVEQLVAASSGRVIAGGTIPAGYDEGAFFSATLIDDVDPASEIAQEEVFGPVLVTTSFDDEADALALANGTDYALLGAVWTRDIGRAHRMAAEIEAGQVYINTYGAGGGVELPFGGFKRSGYGREKGYEAMDAYTQTKTVVVKL